MHAGLVLLTEFPAKVIPGRGCRQFSVFVAQNTGQNSHLGRCFLFGDDRWHKLLRFYVNYSFLMSKDITAAAPIVRAPTRQILHRQCASRLLEWQPKSRNTWNYPRRTPS